MAVLVLMTWTHRRDLSEPFPLTRHLLLIVSYHAKARKDTNASWYAKVKDTLAIIHTHCLLGNAH